MKTSTWLSALLIIVALFASACAPAAPTEAPQSGGEPSGKIVFAYPFQIFFIITLPLSKSILAIVSIFVFMGTWNSFLWPLLMISDPEKQVLTVGLAAMQGPWNTRWPELMAGTVMSIAPIILLLIVFQQYVEEGLSFTGIKS